MEKTKTRQISARRGEKLTSTAITAILIGVVIAVNIIVYTLTTVFGWYFTPSAENYDLTLSGVTDELFADAIQSGKKVTVMFCRPENELPSDLAANTDELGIFYLTAKNFEKRYEGFIELEYVNILNHRKDSGQGDVVPLSDYQLKDENGELLPLYKNSVIFISGDKHKTVSDITSMSFIYDENVSTEYYSSYCGEEVFASMVMRTLEDKEKKVQVTTSHSEKIDAAFGSLLQCSGYEIDIVNLRRESIDDDTDLIVISNPQSDFERASAGSGVVSEIEKLREFVKRGGNIYVALDPYVEKLTFLEEFLAECGISYSETDVEGKILRDIVKDNDNAITMDRVTIVANIADEDIANQVSRFSKNGESNSVILSHCGSLKLQGSAKPLLVTSGSASTYAGDMETDNKGNYCIGATAKYIDEYGKECGNIVMMPTIYLTANDALFARGYSNRNFLYSLTDNKFGADDVPQGCKMIYFNTGVLQNLTTKMMRVYTVLVFTVPVILAAVGAVVVIKRKNR